MCRNYMEWTEPLRAGKQAPPCTRPATQGHALSPCPTLGPQPFRPSPAPAPRNAIHNTRTLLPPPPTCRTARASRCGGPPCWAGTRAPAAGPEGGHVGYRCGASCSWGVTLAFRARVCNVRQQWTALRVWAWAQAVRASLAPSTVSSRSRVPLPGTAPCWGLRCFPSVAKVCYMILTPDSFEPSHPHLVQLPAGVLPHDPLQLPPVCPRHALGDAPGRTGGRVERGIRRQSD